MCSRYSLTSSADEVRHMFACDGLEDFPPRYNIAPAQPVLIVRSTQTQVTGARRAHKSEARLVRWGLIPPWVKDPRVFATLINARSETAAVKPSFRGALRHRRCLVPADGFYEWTGRPGAKQPHLVRLKSCALFALAGVWEHWLGADGSELETMAILTTAANADMAPIHDRMPVILEPAAFERWLDCRPGSSVPVQDLLTPANEGLLEIIAVTAILNNPRAEGPELQTPIPATLP